MSSIYTEETSATHKITRTILDLLFSVRSYGSPVKPSCNSGTEPQSPRKVPKYKSAALDQNNLQKVQLQGAKRKKRLKEKKLEEQQLSERSTLYHYDHKTSETPTTYEDLLKKRLGLKGPIIPYQITKLEAFSSNTDDTSSMAETIRSLNIRSTILLEKQEYLVRNETLLWCDSFLEASDIGDIVEASKNWCFPPLWVPKKMSFRAFMTDNFRQAFRAIENDVLNFQNNSEAIQNKLCETCREILTKQGVTSDFLQYTHSYSRMLEPVEKEFDSLRKLIDSSELKASHIQHEVLERKFLETKMMLQGLPEFFETLLSKRRIAESKLYELNQFCALVDNHQKLNEKIVKKFEILHLEFIDYNHVMQEYVLKLKDHFELLTLEFLVSDWQRHFARFAIALKRSFHENYEAHQILNSIVFRRKQVARNVTHIQRKIVYFERT
ncbi:hypothetical protein METBIDRAFT_230640 [Metschnikowia bicuspidata var. bicuspidata NRRL YB-4993]|uniref:Uncharacterized protein n=1 Tax=Metschnikowia bicuspidata var. bicuspidata NRRL YB-4993 TaxID=869754 RepID=A0A1A0H4W7_9ASCO|nr:hypothetical protein METBIDRAFT_230640 [Metschnikowia bicuspidata var. bicuspidata NRRL YB-4993]OBA18952.1 hypothetical protein METBIDRAFT_230640 [Metschnikowia bicuspidata var. bicuspidata NRRL YB-4993]